MTVAVLISTYNGEKYLKSQLDSIINQQGIDLKIIIRDDGSHDSTREIIKQYKDNYRFIEFIDGENCGCSQSFNQLCSYALNNVNADYYAFCDQDDIWLPTKLKSAVDILEKYDSELPNLYFSNLTMVSENLSYIRNLFEINEVSNCKNLALVQIFTYGCTCVFNYSALKYYCIPKKNVCYHDNWIFIVCALWGNIFYDSTSHILYRQHDSNLSGIKKKGIGLLLQRFKRLFSGLKGNNFEIIACQLNENFREKLSPSDLELIDLLRTYRFDYKSKIKLLFFANYSSGNVIKDLCIKYRIITNHI